MTPKIIKLSNHVGTFHKENNCLYEFITQTKDNYFEYVMIIEDFEENKKF